MISRSSSPGSFLSTLLPFPFPSKPEDRQLTRLPLPSSSLKQAKRCRRSSTTRASPDRPSDRNFATDLNARTRERMPFADQGERSFRLPSSSFGVGGSNKRALTPPQPPTSPLTSLSSLHLPLSDRSTDRRRRCSCSLGPCNTGAREHLEKNEEKLACWGLLEKRDHSRSTRVDAAAVHCWSRARAAR